VEALLDGILCAIERLGCAFLSALIDALNLLIVAVGLSIDALSLLLPLMPTSFTPPGSGVLGVVNWLYPVGPALGGLSLMLTLWVTTLGIRIALRWVKAL
jgi:predicted neutral ceramidase superfamily lipid hydrolase